MLKAARTRFFHQPLSKKLHITVITLTCAILFICSSLFIVYHQWQQKIELEQKLYITGELIQRPLVPVLMDFNDSGITYYLRNLKKEHGIALACLYDPQNNLIADFQHKSQTILCPAQDDIELMLSRDYLLSKHPITHHYGKELGVLWLAADPSLLPKDWPRLTLFLTGLIAIILLTVKYTTQKTQRAIIRPLLHLTRITQLINKHGGYHHRAKKFYNDEIGALTSCFNQMLANIQHTKVDFEQRIQKRTHQLEEEKNRALQAHEAKSEFLRNMSHEIRTPLHGIKSFATYGLNEHQTADPDTLQNYFLRVLQSSERLMILIDNVLTLSRLENGKECFDFVYSDLLSTLKQAEQELEPLLKGKGITIDLATPECQTTTYYDPAKMQQVLVNLLGNAIKFSPRNTSIRIALEEKVINGKEVITVSIRDEGVGIPEKELEAVFEKFSQSSKTNTGAGGTGLGLAISRAIILGHKGAIWISNRKSKQKGALVTFALPKDLTEGKRYVSLGN